MLNSITLLDQIKIHDSYRTALCKSAFVQTVHIMSLSKGESRLARWILEFKALSANHRRNRR